MTAVNPCGANGRISRRSGGSSVHYTWDAQGSLAQRLDGAGAVLTSHLYDAFGAESASGSTTDPYRYGGQWGYYADGETGLCLLTHRYCDPGTGRFLNRDPIGYAGGVNVYGYVTNGPGDAVDPDGFAKGGKKNIRLTNPEVQLRPKEGETERERRERRRKQVQQEKADGERNKQKRAENYRCLPPRDL